MSEIHSVFGDRGAGKSALLVHNLARIYFDYGQELLERSRRIVEKEKFKKCGRRMTEEERS